MATEKRIITLHEALVELKTIDARISKAVDNARLVGITQGQSDKIWNLTKDEFTKKAIASKQSIGDLIALKSIVKAWVMKANAETSIEIWGKKMTIIEAINKKESISLEKVIINRFKNALQNMEAEISRGNTDVKTNLQKIIEITMWKENVKTTGTEIETITKTYLDWNWFNLYDPTNLRDRIIEQEAWIEQFENSIDSKLSVINAITTITI